MLGMTTLLQQILANTEITDPSAMGKEVGDCLDTFKSGANKLQYRSNTFDFQVAPVDQPYHDVCPS